jgi:glutamine amidotransferase
VIAVLDYGIGNLRSAQKGLQRFHSDVRLVTTPEDAVGAAGVVLPGVGAFGRCMEALHATGLGQVAVDAVHAEVPFLGICVGMQLLYEGSEEDAQVPGLGVLRGRVRRLADGVKHPQMQWNRLRFAGAAARECALFAGIDDGAWMYFVHSYVPDASDVVIATCDYGGDVVAAVERGRLWATQFHPEKSSANGLRLLENFVAVCGGPDA